MPSALQRTSPAPLPALVSDLGRRGVRRFAVFFTAELPNPHTRAAYGRAVLRLCDWCEGRGIALTDLEPVGAAAYVQAAKRDLDQFLTVTNISQCL